MRDKILDISLTQIVFSSSLGLEQVMMEWESPIMEKSAEWVCYNRGDILEFGFGMGIFANWIQSYNPKSHTIIENHPQILKKVHLWSQDKPNVKIIEGDWVEVLDKLEKYDGIFFDTYGDLNYKHFGKVVNSLVKSNAHVTWWNNYNKEYNPYGIEDVEYVKIKVSPPKNNYFNFDTYYFPKRVFGYTD
jgi:hypothetical protein